MNKDIRIEPVRHTGQLQGSAKCPPVTTAFIQSEILTPLIPQAHTAQWSELERLIASLNRRFTELEETLQENIQNGYEAGWLAGKQASLEEITEHLVLAQEQARTFLLLNEKRLEARATQIVQQLIPELPQSEVLIALIKSAAKALKLHTLTSISVAPEAVSGMREVAAFEDFEIKADPTLGDLDCVVHSEQGAIQVIWQQRIRALEEGM